jgi:predicted dehydrogenase
MKLLIIGYGSIGGRYAHLAADLGHSVACITRNPGCPFQVFDSVPSACTQWQPAKIVISNITADHASTLASLAAAGFRGDVLVEKPLFGGPDAEVIDANLRVFVAYNLRFHPLIQYLKAKTRGVQLYTASFYAGQYLPDWRPSTDYRVGYSAKAEAGGGVLRDLSHELDLATWLCGPCAGVAAIGGHFSDLDISSDDVFSLLLKGERCPAIAVSVNYLDRVPRRTIAINGQGLSAFVDLVHGRLTFNGETVTEVVAPDDTYRAQLDAFTRAETSTLCSADEGLLTDRLIAKAELAAATASWQKM